MNLQTVVHNIPPLYDSESRVLLLGTIPSPKSREAGSFYAHPQNRFWRVLSAVLDEELPATTDERCAMCLRHHIALWDTAAAVILPVHRIRALKMPCRTISAACCTRRRSPGFLRPAASPPSCTADWSSRRSIFPSHSCPPPVRQTPHGLLRG